MTNEIFNYNGQNITFQLGNGDVMVNLTEVAKAFPRKNLSAILNSQEMVEYLQSLERKNNPEIQIFSSADSQYIKTVRGGDNKTAQGSWAHQKVALRVAQKLSPDFAVWVDEKLEELLTTGNTSLPNFNNPAEAARAWADQYEKRELAEQQVKELEPKGEVYDRISNAVNLLTMAEAAKAVGVGRNKLFKTLREKKVLRHNNTPYQQYIDNGVFQVKVRPINRGSSVENYAQTLVTGKGLSKLSNILTK